MKEKRNGDERNMGLIRKTGKRKKEKERMGGKEKRNG